MDVLKVFKDLDLLVKPAQQDDAAAIKTFKLNVEQFLQTAKPQVSWSSVFHERMLKTHTILSLEQYNQYVEAMKYFIEINSQGSITKMQQGCVALANSLLDFLVVHKMDTDSALIGLSPSNNIYDSCIEPERHLPHQLVGWRALETSAIKAEVRKMADKVTEWSNISKGDLLIIRKSRGENGLVYARYSGEKSKTSGMGSSLSVWVDVFESIVERVPMNQVYFISPHAKQLILSHKEQQISKTILHPAPIMFRKLDMHAQTMTNKFLGSLGIDWDLIKCFDSNSLYMQHVQSGNLELEKLAAVKRITASSLGEKAQAEYLENVKTMADAKAKKYIEQLDMTKIFLPDKKAMVDQILLFSSDIRDGEGRRIAKFISKIDFAFDSLCLQYLGRKKDELNDRILLHIERETNFFLETQGFDFTAVPDNYIEHPPSSLAVVAKNLALLKALFVRESPMYQLASRVRQEITDIVFNFLKNCYIAILFSLGRGLPVDDIPLGPEKSVQHLREVIEEIKAQVSPNIMKEKYRQAHNFTELSLAMSLSEDKIRKCSSLISELEVLYAMTIEHETKEKNVNDVTFGGLVVNVFVRLSEEMKTVLEHWDKKEDKKDDKKEEGKLDKQDSRHELQRQETKSELNKPVREPSATSANWVVARRNPVSKHLELSGKAREHDYRSSGDMGDTRSDLTNSTSSDISNSGKDDSPLIVDATANGNGKDESSSTPSSPLIRVEPPTSPRDVPDEATNSPEASPSVKDEPQPKTEQPVTEPKTDQPEVPPIKTDSPAENAEGSTAKSEPPEGQEAKSPDQIRIKTENGHEVGAFIAINKEKSRPSSLPEVPPRAGRPELPRDRSSANVVDSNNSGRSNSAPGSKSNSKIDVVESKPSSKTGKSDAETAIKDSDDKKMVKTSSKGGFKSDKSEDKENPPKLEKSSSKLNRLTIMNKGRSTTASMRSLFSSKESKSAPPVNPLQLQIAATQNQVSLAYELISQGIFDINIQDAQGWTALHCAAINMTTGQASALEMMILLLTVHGIDANIPNDSQSTPLHILSKTTTSAYPDMSAFLSALDLMMIKGASLTKTNSQGEIPLHLASLSGNIEVVKFLLKAGSDPNALTASQQSCLHYATHRGHTEVVRLLLEYGANPDYAALDGTALTIAQKNKNEEIIQLLTDAIG